MKTILVVPLLFASLAASAGHPRTVTPDQVFGGDYIRIHAPASGTWELMDQSSAGISFAKGDRAASESFIAYVRVFPLPPTSSPQAFEALVEEATERDIDPARFTIQEASVAYTSERPYPCVRYRSVAIDKAPHATSAPLLLESDAIYCRHPVQPESGFAVTYSHRGKRKHPSLRDEAERFIQGVTAPGK